jgi:hypothetical protein
MLYFQGYLDSFLRPWSLRSDCVEKFSSPSQVGLDAKQYRKNAMLSSTRKRPLPHFPFLRGCSKITHERLVEVMDRRNYKWFVPRAKEHRLSDPALGHNPMS